jgi:hypothetical protein
MTERRNFDARARTMQAIALALRHAECPCSASRLARECGNIPVDAIRRVISRLARRGLVRAVAVDQWVAAMPLRSPVPLVVATS